MAERKIIKLAVLIDADNTQYITLTELLAEIAKFGVANIKRAYGDWSSENLKHWKAILNENAIQPIQQFSYTTGKNSTDSSLIIDAMDILHAGNLDGFCIVSSDSDFTRLATRIRESGLTVYGFGEEKTPKPFVSACDQFIYIENLKLNENKKENISQKQELKKIITSAINAVSRDNNWARLSNIGIYITRNIPNFDPRTYGYEKLGKLIRDLDYIEIDSQKFNDDSSNVHIYVKLKD